MKYQVSFDHILRDFITETDELFLRQVLGDLVLHAEIAQDFAGTAAPDPMDILKGKLNTLSVWYLHSTNTSTFDVQAWGLQTRD